MAMGLRHHMHVSPDGYNEFIVSAEYWEHALPEIIQAIVCIRECEEARGVHASFLAAYGQTASQTPLLLYGDDGFTDISPR